MTEHNTGHHHIDRIAFDRLVLGTDEAEAARAVCARLRDQERCPAGHLPGECSDVQAEMAPSPRPRLFARAWRWFMGRRAPVASRWPGSGH